MDKAQEIANKILKSTPHLANHIPNDSIFKNQALNSLQPTPNLSQAPSTKRPENMRDSKKKHSNLIGAPQAGAANNYGIMFKGDYSSVDWQKKYSELEMRYKKLEEDMRLLQGEKDEKEHRYVKREEGYRRLVDELHEELRRDFSLNGEERKKMEEIAGLHTKINDNIANIQLKTSKVLLDQEKDIIRFFNNKINDIKKQFEEERVKRSQKDQSYEVKEKQLIAELEWIKDIAQKIDQENHSLMKKYMDLKANFSTHENDREILLREVILKKKKNAILKSQVEQYEKVLDDVVNEKDGSHANLLRESVDKSINKNQANNSQTLREQEEQFLNASQYSARGTHNLNVTTAKNEMSNYRAEQVINKLKAAYQKEKRKVQQLKTMYIKEMESKSQLEKVIRSCIEDMKEELNATQKERSRRQPAQSDSPDRNERATLIEKMINDERILTLIYDKTFYAGNKKIEIPPELLKDDEDDDNLFGII